MPREREWDDFHSFVLNRSLGREEATPPAGKKKAYRDRKIILKMGLVLVLGKFALVPQWVYIPGRIRLPRSSMRATRHITQPGGNHLTIRHARNTVSTATAPANSSGWLRILRTVSKPWWAISKGLCQAVNAFDNSLRWAAAIATRVARRSANSIAFVFIGNSTVRGLLPILRGLRKTGGVLPGS